MATNLGELYREEIGYKLVPEGDKIKLEKLTFGELIENYEPANIITAHRALKSALEKESEEIDKIIDEKRGIRMPELLIKSLRREAISRAIRLLEQNSYRFSF